MKQNYRLQCIRRDKKYDGDIVTYNITPIQRGLDYIQKFIDNNELKVSYYVKRADSEEAIFMLQGRKKEIRFCIHSLLCNSNLSDYFKVEEWF
jgi:hypothetical protein